MDVEIILTSPCCAHWLTQLRLHGSSVNTPYWRHGEEGLLLDSSPGHTLQLHTVHDTSKFVLLIKLFWGRLQPTNQQTNEWIQPEAEFTPSFSEVITARFMGWVTCGICSRDSDFSFPQPWAFHAQMLDEGDSRIVPAWGHTALLQSAPQLCVLLRMIQLKIPLWDGTVHKNLASYLNLSMFRICQRIAPIWMSQTEVGTLLWVWHCLLFYEQNNHTDYGKNKINASNSSDLKE